jgi:hypothetical protein
MTWEAQCDRARLGRLARVWPWLPADLPSLGDPPLQIELEEGNSVRIAALPGSPESWQVLLIPGPLAA